MSVIQKIRDKYAVVIVVVICLAIVSFLLQDAFFGKNSLIRRSTVVGKVNGEELEFSDYQQMIKASEDRMRQGNNMLAEQITEQARESAWNQFLSKQIMDAQYQKLGLAVTDEEIKDQFTGKNPSPVVAQQFTDEKTGQFDRARMQQVLANISQDKTGQMRAGLLQLEDYIAQSRISEKYLSLVKQAVYYPKWLAEKQIADNGQVASISYVSVPYATIADSTIKVTDSELNTYINNHKELFKTEESRKVDYLSFNVIPSAADTAAALKVLFEAKQELDTISNTDVAAFINRNSDLPFYDSYIAKSALMVPQKDTLLSLPNGAVFGPYYDNNLIVFAKMIDRKLLPDSVKVRHILIATQNQQGGGLPDSIAKARVDSIERAVRGGADFKALVQQYTDDASSKPTGGEYDVTPSSELVKEFKDFALEKSKGSIGVVKTVFGYHLIEVMDQKNVGQAVKIAYLAKPVAPSRETDSKAYAEANEFASKNRDQKTFEKNIQQNGLNKRIADNLRPMDHMIPGIGQARELVRWAYDAKKGDVSNVFTFDNNYVVAVLTAVREEGVAALEDVRPAVEAEVRKGKKATQIIEKLQSPASLEAAQKATNQPEQKAEGLSFGTPFVASLGFEPRVVGAAFNKSWGTAKVSAPIEGNAGVYVIKVDNFQASGQPQDPKSVSRAYEQSLLSALDQQLFSVLKKLSKIEDNRSKFF
ncbi:peptidylprolyl isomerase [Chitinophaga sp. S165]|uniref:peptidylprolyl isomerase n=1 Tax=Chitinophaga sp. S165 TaxID=2135462 RepID=UPI000D71D4E1|nr:peptidylprolyl isomerase [Chitinophaga sp. S165]PWV53880.1 peptidyl-prolyl cis-trans isomerase D [Chitinophaga sp. S165]